MTFLKKKSYFGNVLLSNRDFVLKKTKWSVWSIETFSTIRIWKVVIEKGSYDGKLKFSRGLKIKCSSITPFLDHKNSIPYCRTCSYGPYGPFWFSAKNRRDLVKRYQNLNFWEKSIFHFIRKMNLFYGGNFLERTPWKLIFSLSDS